MTVSRFLTHNDPEVRNFAKFLIDLINNQGFILEKESITDSFMFWLSKTTLDYTKNELRLLLRFEYHYDLPSVVVALYREGIYIGGNHLRFSFVAELESLITETSWFSLVI